MSGVSFVGRDHCFHSQKEVLSWSPMRLREEWLWSKSAVRSMWVISIQCFESDGLQTKGKREVVPERSHGGWSDNLDGTFPMSTENTHRLHSGEILFKLPPPPSFFFLPLLSFIVSFSFSISATWSSDIFEMARKKGDKNEADIREIKVWGKNTAVYSRPCLMKNN